MIGATRDLLATIDQKRREGCDISCDAIPYTIGSTTLKSLLPPWALAGGDEELLRRLQDPETRAKIEQDTRQYGAESGGSRKRNLARDGDWDKIWAGQCRAKRRSSRLELCRDWAAARPESPRRSLRHPRRRTRPAVDAGRGRV